MLIKSMLGKVEKLDFVLVNKESELIGLQLVGFYLIITFLFRYHINDGIM